jgi:predicted ArsR family transcriptional regulator
MSLHNGIKNTRHQILDILKREGPQDAGSLSRRLSITPMAIGLQLAALEEENFVLAESPPNQDRKRGRPLKYWRITEAANSTFPDAHAQLTVGLLNTLQEVYGAAGIEKLIEARTRQYIDEYSRALPLQGGINERIKALATLRDREGYMTEVKPLDGGGYLLIENHCPICIAAKTCQSLCQSEGQVFQKLLGPEMQVTRQEHILSGDRRCAYAIQPIFKGALPESP